MRASRRQLLRWLTAVPALGVSGVGRLCAQGSSPIRMVNGAEAAGLDFVLRNGAQGRMYQVESMPGGLGVIDFDGDGWPDLFCTNGAELPSLKKNGQRFWNRLYKNNRDGTFTDVTQKAGLQGEGFSIGVAVGDYNNDGHEDIFVAGVHRNTLYRNNGDGTFTDVTEAAGLGPAKNVAHALWAVSASWVDYDSDGRLDLFISNYCDWDPGIDPICGGISPEMRDYCHPNLYKAEPMQLFHNNGDGTFTEVALQAGHGGQGLGEEYIGKGMGIAMADYAGDGHPALFVANDNARNLLFRNHGKGFEEVGLDAGVAFNGDGRNISGMGADFGDFRGKGVFDLVMTGLKNDTYEVFLNQGDGTFEDGGIETGLLNLSRKWNGWGCGFADFDNDGWLDLFIACGGLMAKEPQSNRVFQNHGGRFIDLSDAAGIGDHAAQHRCVVFADFDRDGRMDAAVSAIDARIELWWNRSEREKPVRNWLQVKLRGTKSNLAGIGSLVSVTAGGRRQIRTLTNSVGYASSSELLAHFGLAEAQSASIEVQWPSGIRQKLEGVKANQRIEVAEAAQ